MKSLWARAGGLAEGTSPVEMRFVDMFMATLGSLIFIIMLLIVLVRPEPSEVNISGTIIEVNGDHAIIQPEEGMPKRITLPDGVDVRQTAPGKRSAVTVGATVSASGRDGRGGQFKATRLSVHADQSPATPSLTKPPQDNDKSDPILTEDIDVLRRWLNVSIIVERCPELEFFFYVRTSAKLTDRDTGKPNVDPLTKLSLGEAIEFDMGRIIEHPYETYYTRTRVNGDSYSKINIAPSQDWQVHNFRTVSRFEGAFSIYFAIANPRNAATSRNNCQIRPIYETVNEIHEGDLITLNASQPFAWLRQLTLNKDGSSSLRVKPIADKEFIDKLIEFSKRQSSIICEKHKLCNTRDAHLASLRPDPIPPRLGQARFTIFENFELDGGDINDPVVPIRDVDHEGCANFCQGNPLCVAYEYDKWSKWCYLKSSVTTLRLEPRAVTGVRAGQPAPRRYQSPIRMDRRAGRSFSDGGETTASRGVDECEERCLRANACIGYTFTKSSKRCKILKLLNMPSESDSDATSGWKRQVKP